MRVALSSKLAMPFALGIGTFIVTGVLVARGPSRHAAQAGVAEPNRPSLLTYESKTPPGIAAPRPRSPHSIYSGAMRRFQAEADGHWVHVAAETRIRDTRPNVQYVWSFRVYDLADSNYEHVLFERRYDHQIFSMPPEQEMEPTFEDVIEVPLPRGAYVVELVALMITPRDGIEGLDVPETIRRLRGPRGLARLTID